MNLKIHQKGCRCFRPLYCFIKKGWCECELVSWRNLHDGTQPLLFSLAHLFLNSPTHTHYTTVGGREHTDPSENASEMTENWQKVVNNSDM